MNTIWSTYLQKAETLYKTRLLRFSDVFAEAYKKAFDIGNKPDILEIGCGPGALSQALQRWYPNAKVQGIDRDSYFVKFAAEQAPHILFSEADATVLPFMDSSFDVTISNTVQEHVEPAKFYGEQYRVLKPGGICLVLSARRGINITAPVISAQSDFETELSERTSQYYDETNKKYDVCTYPMTEAELPHTMAKYGFQNIATHYLTINLTPDSAAVDPSMAIEMINANRQVHLDSVKYLPDIAPGVLAEAELTEWKRIINEKYDQRLRQYQNEEKQWDTNMSLTMVIRGEK